MSHRLTPTNALEFESFAVNEVYIDLDREAILHIAKHADTVILRVQTFGPKGRPSTRSLRIPREMLEDFDTPNGFPTPAEIDRFN